MRITAGTDAAAVTCAKINERAPSRTVIGSNVGPGESPCKKLICSREMLSPDVLGTQSPATVQRQHYKSRRNSPDLGISQTQSSSALEQLLAGRTDQFGCLLGALFVVDEAGDEHHRGGQRIGLDRVGRSQLEELLRTHLRKERGEMKQPVFPLHSRLIDPL